MAKIVRFHQTGGPEVLRIEEVPSSPPGDGEVRIAVKAIGLNRAECLFRQGTYLEAPSLPSGLGYEAAQVHAYLSVRAQGSQGRRPKPKRWRE